MHLSHSVCVVLQAMTLSLTMIAVGPTHVRMVEPVMVRILMMEASTACAVRDSVALTVKQVDKRTVSIVTFAK